MIPTLKEGFIAGIMLLLISIAACNKDTGQYDQLFPKYTEGDFVYLKTDSTKALVLEIVGSCNTSNPKYNIVYFDNIKQDQEIKDVCENELY